MFIDSVISYLNGWSLLQKVYPTELEDLQKAIQLLDIEGMPKIVRKYRIPQHILRREPDRERTFLIELVEAEDVHRLLSAALEERNWSRDVRLNLASRIYHPLLRIDLLKGDVAVEFGFKKDSPVEARLFAGFPILINAQKCKLVVVLTPMKSLSKKISGSYDSFERLENLFTNDLPTSLKYPFVIIGFSENENGIRLIEPTPALDNFLINTLGLSLAEMLLQDEKAKYEFKATVPDNKKLAQEVCAFANSHSGGLILFGVDKDRKVVGIPVSEDLDGMQLKITNVIRDTCEPIPKFSFHLFDNPRQEGTLILLLKVEEIQNKPCMTDHRVYIRSGPSVRPAKSNEIRRLVNNVG